MLMQAPAYTSTHNTKQNNVGTCACFVCVRERAEERKRGSVEVGNIPIIWKREDHSGIVLLLIAFIR